MYKIPPFLTCYGNEGVVSLLWRSTVAGILIFTGLFAWAWTTHSQLNRYEGTHWNLRDSQIARIQQADPDLEAALMQSFDPFQPREYIKIRRTLPGEE